MFLFVAPIIILLFILVIVWRRKRRYQQKQVWLKQLRNWVAHQNELEPVLQQWILHLPETEAQVLLELLVGYCISLNWELSWLFAPQIEKAPALKAVLEESVIAYTCSILRSLQLEEDVHAYQVYLAFERKPTARKQRTLVQQLYTKVNDKGLTPSTKRFFRRFSRQTVSRKEQVAAIQKAFEQDSAQAMDALKEVLAEDIMLAVQREKQGRLFSFPTLS